MRSTSPRRPARAGLLFLILVIVATTVVTVATAADPDEGTLSLDTRQLTWSGEASGTTIAYPDPRAECTAAVAAQCDTYTLNVDIDPSHWDDNGGGAEVLISWESAENDFDLTVYQGAEQIGQSARSDTTSERVFIPSASSDGGAYTVIVSPFDVTDTSYGGGVRLESRPVFGGPTGGDVPSEPLSGVKCEDGMAGPFPCSNVDLAAFMPVSEIGGTQPVPGDIDPTISDLVNDNLNDIWGWTDPQTEREYALVGKTDGTAFVDVTDPENPVYRGTLVSRQNAGEIVPAETIFKNWRDLKVYKDHVYIGSEEPAHGLQVFDLRRLREDTPATGLWTEDAGYDGFGNSHNIVINEESGFLYAVGTDTCAGGPHVVDIRDPQDPTEAGCIDEDGYTHDAQCVNYDGPDANYAGREICFNSNEDTVTIVDVTDKENPEQLSKVTYDGAAYTHQGWLTPDGSRFIVNDEQDETGSGIPTTTRIFNVEKLNAPSLVGQYEAKVGSIDHNLYTKNDTLYEANYRSGLRILDGREAREARLSEIGYFDVFPADDEAEFNGAWSNYPYFPSGTVVVSGIEQGLFVLRPNEAAGGADGRLGDDEAPPAAPSTASPEPSPPTAATAPSQRATPCVPDGGFRSVAVRRGGKRGVLRLAFVRRVMAPVTIDVLRQSAGRRIATRRVARFAGRTSSVRWNGRATRRGAKVRNGFYLVRYRMRTPHGVDRRRVVVRRKGGTWSVRPRVYRRGSCRLLRNFKLGRSVFGGRKIRPLAISYRLSRAGTATVTVRRAGKLVKRFRPRSVAAYRTVHLRLSARKLRRGNYTVRLSATSGDQRITSKLGARRL